MINLRSLLVGLVGAGVFCLKAADFISIPGAAPSPLPGERAGAGTAWFMKSFELEDEVVAAELHVTGLGVFEAYVNGKVVGEHVLKPGFNHVYKTKPLFAYEVTSMLKRGRNTLVGEVSAGWWRDKIVNFAGKKSAFYAVLTIKTVKGETLVVETDTTWKGAVAGAVERAGIFDGEIYDARKVQPVNGDETWAGVEKNTEFGGVVKLNEGAEVVLRRDLAFVRGPYSLKAGQKWTVDFGQNCAAVPEFVFKAKPGTRLVFLPAEMLNDAGGKGHGCDGSEGTIYRRNLRVQDSCMRLEYVFGSEKEETYRPRFTYFGYRYAEIFADGEVEIKSVKSIPVTSVTKAMETGFIETGNEDVNKLISNIYWGQLSNYLSVPTDCPQRNERLGWTADTQVFAEAGAFNADTRRFLRKWMRDMRDSQSEKGGYPSVAPWAQYGNETMRLGWSDAGIIVPYTIWLHFGDQDIVRENWDSMVRYMRHVDETKFDFEAIRGEARNYQYADWLSYEALESCSGRCFITADGQTRLGLRPEAVEYWNFLGACYWHNDALMMAAMGAAIGKEAEEFSKMAARAKQYLQATFFAPGCAQFKTAIFDSMQTPRLFALKLGLNEGAACNYMKYYLRHNFEQHGNRLQTGFLGTSILLDTLSAHGMTDIAYSLLLQHENPSWLYSVDQGATTVWERWNSYTRKGGFGPVGMNSFNHYAYGSVLSWMYKTIAGIAPTPNDPGFRTIVMHPQPSRRLGHVQAEFRSAQGLIKSAWRYEGEKWIWAFTVPVGAKALVSAPGETEAVTYGPGSYSLERKLP